MKPEEVLFKGVLVDIIEIFSEYALVQDPEGNIFLIGVEHIDSAIECSYDGKEENITSNVLSIKGFTEWLVRKQTQEQSLSNQKISKPLLKKNHLKLIVPSKPLLSKKK